MFLFCLYRTSCSPAGVGGRAVSSSSYWQLILNLSFLNENLASFIALNFIDVSMVISVYIASGHELLYLENFSWLSHVFYFRHKHRFCSLALPFPL